MGKHQIQITGDNNASYQISSTPWNNAHDDIIPAKASVKKVGSNYKVYDETGAYIAGATYSDAYVAINDEAIAGLTDSRTHMEKIILQGDFTLDTEAIAGESFLELEIQGKVKLADAADIHLINIDEDFPRCIDIHGGELDGNSAEQTVTTINGINIVGDTEVADWWSRSFIHHTNIRDVVKHGISCVLSNGCRTILYLDTVKSACGTSQGNGVYCFGMADFAWTNVDLGGNDDDALKMVGCGAGTIAGLRTDGSVTFQACSQIGVTPIFIDCYNRDVNGVTIYNSSQISLAVGHIRQDASAGYNTKSAVLFLDDAGTCRHNQVTGVYLGRPQPYTATNRWNYGIEENSSFGQTPDSNIFSVLDGSDCITAAIKKLGANSTTSAIIGSVV